MLSQTNFQTLILMKLVASFIYLAVNYITHTYQLPVTLANVLRLFISCLDFVILLAIIFHYVCEWFLMAYSYSIIGILFSIFICALNWAILIRQDNRVQPVFIIGTFSLIVLLVLYWQFISMGLGYKGLISALFTYNTIYISCWLLFDPYAKAITRFMERVGDTLSWVDPLIGEIPHNALALRNVCSFNLGLLNLTYMHTSGGAVNIIIIILIGLGLLTNVLIGLRLIKESASITLKHGFMVQIIKHGYSNIAKVFNQLKNKQLPKATWYAWAMVLTIGLVFTSPSYAMPLNVNEGQVSMPSPFEIDESQNQEIFETADSGQPIGESTWRQSARYVKEIFDHNLDETIKRVKSAPADLIYAAGKTGAVAGAGVIGKLGYDYWYSSEGAVEEHETAQTDSCPTYVQLLEANQKKDETIQTQASIIDKQNNSLIEKDKIIAQLQNKSWFTWLKGCWKRPSN